MTITIVSVFCFIFGLIQINYLASSASSPASTSRTRQINITPDSHHQQLQIRRRQQQHKMATGSLLRIQHQNKSDPSSSDDGMSMPIMHHRVAVGLHLAHTKTIAHAGLLSEAIELQTLVSPQAPVPPIRSRHRSVDHEDSVRTTSTMSPRTFSSDRDTIETNLSVATCNNSVFERDECSYKRSRSYHGKGSN